MKTLILSAVIFCLPANAFLLQPQPRVCTELSQSNRIVFTGTVLQKRYRLDDRQDFIEATVYTLSVAEVFVGDLSNEVEVETLNNSARRLLDVGQSYLLFAREYEETMYIFGGGNSNGYRQLNFWTKP